MIQNCRDTSKTSDTATQKLFSKTDLAVSPIT